MLIIAFIVVAGLYVFDKFWGIPALNKRIADQKEEIQDLKRDRDAKAAQLAPFQALANKAFEAAPEDKRLDLLLKKIDEVAQTLKETNKKIQTHRSFSPQTSALLKANLLNFTGYKATITCVLGDADSFQLANEIKAIFESGGWQVDGVNQAIWTKPFQGIVVGFKEYPRQICKMLCFHFGLNLTIIQRPF